jgi:hypothetical protein
MIAAIYARKSTDQTISSSGSAAVTQPREHVMSYGGLIGQEG